MKKSTKEEFIKKAIKIHNNEYMYSLVDYVGSKIKVRIICNKHGGFLQRPNDHLSGYGCKKCQYDKLSKLNTLTYDGFLKKAKKKHGYKYGYNLVKYINSDTKIEIICEKHGVFMQTPHNHFNGSGCPRCKESRNEEKIRLFLEKYKINYEQEKRFNDCIDKSYLFYDFYLPDYNLLIEYNGKQHYKSIDFFNGKNGLNERKKRDKIKRDYVIKNNYYLLVLPYTLNQWNNDLIEETLKNTLKI